MRAGAVLLMLSLAACAGGGGTAAPEPRPGVEAAIKITFFQFAFNRMRQPVPEYCVMLSRTWSLTYGPVAGEPFERYVRNPYKGSEIRDGDLDLLARQMSASGWDDLPSCELGGVDTARLAAMEREMRSNPMARDQYIYITVQTPASKKTVFGRDALMAGPASQAAFNKCLELVIKGRLQHTAQITVELKPIGK